MLIPKHFSLQKKRLIIRWLMLWTSVLFFYPAMAQVPPNVPLNGLIGAWTFSGDATDQSGNGNDGTVYGATLTYDRCGNPNSAYNFAVISLTNCIQMLSPGPTGTLSRSVSFWARTNTSATGRVAFDYVGVQQARLTKLYITIAILMD